MKIQGLQRVSLLDYPGQVACTVFTSGCNLRCPFCHNASLVLPNRSHSPEMEAPEFFEFLVSRQGKLDGVCISGGEPLLQPDLETFIRKIRDFGFSVKLDTNGSMPHLLKDLVGKGLVDYVAMDIKNCPERYSETAGITELSLEGIQESAAFLLSGAVPFEFRTTIVEEFHTEQDMERLGKWIEGNERYYLQPFIDSGDLITSGLHAVSLEKMEAFKRIVSAYVPLTQLRGV